MRFAPLAHGISPTWRRGLTAAGLALACAAGTGLASLPAIAAPTTPPARMATTTQTASGRTAITGVPADVTIKAAHHIKYKSTLWVTGQVINSATESGVPGATVVLQRKLASSRWYTQSTATTDASGAYTFSIQVRATTSYRVKAKATAATWSATSSATKTKLKASDPTLETVLDMTMARLIKYWKKDCRANPTKHPDQCNTTDPTSFYNAAHLRGSKRRGTYAQITWSPMTSKPIIADGNNYEYMEGDTEGWRKINGTWRYSVDLSAEGPCSWFDGKGWPRSIVRICTDTKTQKDRAPR
jgi:hypothetical protein